MTSNIGNVTIEHHKREYGSSGYTLKKLIHLWLSYFNYTVVPLRFVSIMGGTTAGLGFVFGIITAIRKLLDPGMPAGWASIICIMLLFFGMVLLSLGIIGEYIGNIVLTLNSTPQYIIREKVNL
jgi:undecaprenyl-phosphate 4-deoxy-4-formamido-L-arabinose transferase